MLKSNIKKTQILVTHLFIATLSLILVEKRSAIAAYIAGGGCSSLPARCDRVKFKLDGKLFFADFVEDSFPSLKSQHPNAFPFINDFDKTQQAETSLINSLNSADPVPTDLVVANSSGQTFRSSRFVFPLGIPEPGAVINESIVYGFPPGTPSNSDIPQSWVATSARPTGEDTIQIYPLIKEVPEPLTILGITTAFAGGVLLKKKYPKRLISSKD